METGVGTREGEGRWSRDADRSSESTMVTSAGVSSSGSRSSSLVAAFHASLMTPSRRWGAVVVEARRDWEATGVPGATGAGPRARGGGRGCDRPRRRRRARGRTRTPNRRRTRRPREPTTSSRPDASEAERLTCDATCEASPPAPRPSASAPRPRTCRRTTTRLDAEPGSRLSTRENLRNTSEGRTERRARFREEWLENRAVTPSASNTQDRVRTPYHREGARRGVVVRSIARSRG